MLSDNVNIKL